MLRKTQALGYPKLLFLQILGKQAIYVRYIGACVMITTNIDVADGLTNGAMGTIVNIVYNDSVKQIRAVFVKFDCTTIGENAKNEYILVQSVQCSTYRRNAG